MKTFKDYLKNIEGVKGALYEDRGNYRFDIYISMETGLIRGELTEVHDDYVIVKEYSGVAVVIPMNLLIVRHV